MCSFVCSTVKCTCRQAGPCRLGSEASICQRAHQQYRHHNLCWPEGFAMLGVGARSGSWLCLVSVECTCPQASPCRLGSEPSIYYRTHQRSPYVMLARGVGFACGLWFVWLLLCLVSVKCTCLLVASGVNPAFTNVHISSTGCVSQRFVLCDGWHSTHMLWVCANQALSPHRTGQLRWCQSTLTLQCCNAVFRCQFCAVLSPCRTVRLSLCRFRTGSASLV
jgi:hypothetical protein